MKPTTYYIQGRNGVCIKANKIGALLPFLPDKKTLQLHMLNEAAILTMNEGKYTPKPVMVSVETFEIEIMLREIRRKLKDFSIDHVPLRLQSNNLPIVIIYKKQENDKSENK
jgi:hypothetical protein